MKKLWARFKVWFVGVLVALGLVTAVVISAPVSFTYTPADQYEDGTPLPIEQIAETRLYCTQTPGSGYTLVASEAGADATISADLAPGDWECVATHVATNSQESSFSNTATRSVLPTVPPNAPTLNP